MCFFSVTVGECKERWRNLRSTFVKNIRPKPSGSAGGKKKPYYLTEAMQFAVPFLKVAGTPSGNLPEIPEERPFPSTTPEAPITGDAQQDIILSADVFSEPQNQTANQRYDSISTRPPAPTTPPQLGALSASWRDSLTPSEPQGLRGQVTRKRKLKNTPSDADKAFSEYFAAKKATLLKRSSEDDKREGIKHFLNSLIPDLMKMDDVQLRRYKRTSLATIDEVMGTSPEVLYRPSTSVIQAFQGTATAGIPATMFEVPRSSISSPVETTLSVLTDSSGCLYVQSPSELSPEEIQSLQNLS